MKLKILAVYFLLVFQLSLFAQAPIIEYGSPSELQGIESIYIYTGTNTEVRQNMIKEIAKSAPLLKIADRPEDAQVLILFAADAATFLSSIHSTTQGGYTSTTPNYRSVLFGSGTVVKSAGQNRMRVLMQFNESRHSVFERRPSTNIARDFVKAYLKANGKK